MRRFLPVVLSILCPPLAIPLLLFGAFEPKPKRVYPTTDRIHFEIDLAKLRLTYQKVLLELDEVLQDRRLLRELEPYRLKLEQSKLIPPVPQIIREQVREIEVRQILAPAEPQKPAKQPRLKRKPPEWVIEFEEQIKVDELSLDRLNRIRLENPDMHPSLLAKLDLAEQKLREALDIKINEGRMQILKRKIE